MTLVIENGTGVAGADSFVTGAEYVTFVSAFFGDTVTANEPAIRRAFVFMSNLPWKPDTYPLFYGAIPQAVKNAQAVFARAEFQSVGVLSPQVTVGGAKTLVEVKGIKWQAKASPNTVEAARPVITMAMDFLQAAGLLKPDTGGVRFLERA